MNVLIDSLSLVRIVERKALVCMVNPRIKKFVKQHKALYSLYMAALMKIVIRRRELREKYPYDLNFELTTRCNSLCSYCPREEYVKKGVRDEGDTRNEVVDRIVQEFSSLPVKKRMVGPSGLGETLLYPGLIDLISALRKNMPDAHIHTNTNAIGLSEKIAKGLVDSGLSELILSVNAWDSETYRKINQVDAYEKVVQNVELFLKIKGNRKPAALIQILDIDENKPHIEAFKEHWQPLLNENDRFYVRPFHDFGGTVDADKFKQQEEMKRYPCIALFRTVMIDKDGYVYPCCMGLAHGPKSDICLGNIFEKDLKQLFSKESRVAELRKLQLQGKYSQINACNNCNSWKVMPNIFIKIAGRWY